MHDTILKSFHSIKRCEQNKIDGC